MRGVGDLQVDLYYLATGVSMMQAVFGFVLMPLMAFPAFGGIPLNEVRALGDTSTCRCWVVLSICMYGGLDLCFGLLRRVDSCVLCVPGAIADVPGVAVLPRHQLAARRRLPDRPRRHAQVSLPSMCASICMSFVYTNALGAPML